MTSISHHFKIENPLNSLQDLLLELTLHLLALVISCGLAVESQEGTQVELGGLEQLNLANVDLKRICQITAPATDDGGKGTYILQGVDALGGLLDLTTNDLRDELVGELRQSAAGSLTLHNLGHLLADGTDLRRAGVSGLLDLVGASLGEGDGEQTDEVVVSGLHGDVGLNQRLPLANKGAQLVGGEVQTVEVGQAVLALDLIHTELDLAESVVLIVLQVSEGDLEDTALEGVVGVLQTASAVDQSLADTFQIR